MQTVPIAMRAVSCSAGALEWPLRLALVVGGIALATPGGGIVPLSELQMIGLGLAILVPTLVLALLLMRLRRPA